MNTLENLEYHITDKCNLNCKNCAHYSNLHRSSRVISIEEAIEEWSEWSELIHPRVFWILGGEPTLNKNLDCLILAAKQIWKKSVIGLITNGLKLKNHYALMNVLANTKLNVSLYGIREEEIRNNITACNLPESCIVWLKELSDTWYQFYKTTDRGIEPYTDNNQRKSWEICQSKKCHVLRDGKLWKCPPVTFSKSVGIDWFDEYDPCGPQDDIRKWLDREDETCCKNCPAAITELEPMQDKNYVKIPIVSIHE